MAATPRAPAAGWLVTVLRVLVGGTFLYEAAVQLRKGWIGGDGLERMLGSALRDNSIVPPYRSFLEDVVLPNAGALTPFIVAGEIAVGVALVAGLFTRLTALGAFGMNFGFLLMNSVTFGGLIDAVFLLFEAVIIIFAPRQLLSADGYIARHRGLRAPWMSGDVAQPAA